MKISIKAGGVNNEENSMIKSAHYNYMLQTFPSKMILPSRVAKFPRKYSINKPNVSFSNSSGENPIVGVFVLAESQSFMPS